MIATHNTLTYNNATNPLVQMCGRWWRCQNLSVEEQIKAGAGYLDIRVRYTMTGKVLIAHGIATMRGLKFRTIEELCQWLDKFGAMYRIILERGGEFDRGYFIADIKEAAAKHPLLMWAVVKEGWEEVYVAQNHPRIVDLCLHWNSRLLFRSLFRNVIKEFAEMQIITEDMIKDEGTVYFMDYLQEQQ